MSNEAVTMDIFGEPELNELFDELKAVDKRKIFIRAFQQAAKPLIRSAKSERRAARKRKSITGNALSKSFGTGAVKRLTILKVGARMYGGYGGRVGHLVNDGTVERFYTTKKGKVHRTGAVTGTKFWNKAMDVAEGAMKDEIQRHLVTSLMSFVDRYNKKHKTET